MAALTGVDRIVADRMWRDPPTRAQFEKESGLTDIRDGNYHLCFRIWAAERLRLADFRKELDAIIAKYVDPKDTPSHALALMLETYLKVFDGIKPPVEEAPPLIRDSEL